MLHNNKKMGHTQHNSTSDEATTTTKTKAMTDRPVFFKTRRSRLLFARWLSQLDQSGTPRKDTCVVWMGPLKETKRRQLGSKSDILLDVDERPTRPVYGRRNLSARNIAYEFFNGVPIQREHNIKSLRQPTCGHYMCVNPHHCFRPRRPTT